MSIAFLSRKEIMTHLCGQARWVRACLAEGDMTSWTPHLLALAREGPESPLQASLFAMAVPFNEDDEKEGVMREIAAQLYKQRMAPMAAILSAEAWMAENPPDGVEPRHCDNRKEVVLLMACSVDLTHQMMLRIATRRDRDNHLLCEEGAEDFLTAEDCRTPVLYKFFAGFLDAVRSGRKP